MAGNHAKLRPPSDAARWLSCSASVKVIPLYPREDSKHSLKGDYSHELLENAILFGLMPDTDDVDTNENVISVVEYIAQRRKEYGAETLVYAEQTLEIPETGEFGTTDAVIVSPKVLEILDYKNGYVMVGHKRNPQMMTYLLGAIAKYGERDKYRITVAQPNASHIDGPIRTYELDADDLWRFRAEVKWAIENAEFKAGKHCKKTYCPHRGACKTFLAWAETNGADAWFTSEINAMTDDQLAQALDHAEILQGIRDELRKEAMRRILQMDRHVHGYKIVKGRTSRSFIDEEPVKAKLRDIGVPDEDMYEKTFTTVAGVERLIKAYSKPLGRGKWKQVWENTVGPHVREFTGGLTLERATDARPAHRRGSEFGPLNTPDANTKVTTII